MLEFQWSTFKLCKFYLSDPNRNKKLLWLDEKVSYVVNDFLL